MKPKVWVTPIAARRTLVVRWREFDGSTGQETVGRLTGEKRKDAELMREAQSRASEITKELRDEAGTAEGLAVVSWYDFRKRFESD